MEYARHQTTTETQGAPDFYALPSEIHHRGLILPGQLSSVYDIRTTTVASMSGDMICIVVEISKTADQALKVLLAVSENGPHTPAQLARDLKMNRTVIHRLLATLHQRGFVIRQDDGYVPGTILIRIAEHVQPELRARGRAAMLRLAEDVHESVVMHIRDGDDAVVLDQVVSDMHVVRVEHKIGSRHPLVKGASGRAILAFLDDATIGQLTGSDEHPETIKRQLEGVRQLGYALSHDELQMGVHGLAAPVLDASGHAMASMAILVPATRAINLTQHIGVLLEAAPALARAIHGVQALAPISAPVLRPLGQANSKWSLRPSHQGTVVSSGRVASRRTGE